MKISNRNLGFDHIVIGPHTAVGGVATTVLFQLGWIRPVAVDPLRFGRFVEVIDNTPARASSKKMG